MSQESGLITIYFDPELCIANSQLYIFKAGCLRDIFLLDELIFMDAQYNIIVMKYCRSNDLIREQRSWKCLVKTILMFYVVDSVHLPVLLTLYFILKLHREILGHHWRLLAYLWHSSARCKFNNNDLFIYSQLRFFFSIVLVQIQSNPNKQPPRLVII